MRTALLLLCLLIATKLVAQTTTIPLLPGENWWGGRIADAPLMPFQPGYAADLRWNNGNQVQPLLLSDQGRFVWCETTFAFVVTDSTLVITSKRADVQHGKIGATLSEAYRFAAENLFPFKGKISYEQRFTAPHYTTRTEQTQDQHQAGILAYAHSIIAHGFPPGVLIIGDGWQQDYGEWNFHPDRFPSPKAMMDELHELGFRVMLWVCPFVSADSPMFGELYEKHDAFLLDPNHPQAALQMKWRKGLRALLDFTHPPAQQWFRGELDRLQRDFGIDGFKLEGGDFEYFHWAVPHQKNTGFAEQSELYGRIGLDYPLNEYRASFKLGGEPLVQRLEDKSFTWEELQQLIPSMNLLGMMGYPFACPGAIGGDEDQSFGGDQEIDQELMVRWAQAQALLPMMQFSVAPWQVLDAEHLVAVHQAALLHQEFGPLLLQLAKEAAASGEPIVKSMEYAFPAGHYSLLHDQFMLGKDYLVAPVLAPGVREREVVLPPGKWAYVPSGEVFVGPATVKVEVPLGVLGYFRRG